MVHFRMLNPNLYPNLTFESHLEDTVHCFEYLSTHCTEIAHFGPNHDDLNDCEEDDVDNGTTLRR